MPLQTLQKANDMAEVPDAMVKEWAANTDTAFKTFTAQLAEDDAQQADEDELSAAGDLLAEAQEAVAAGDADFVEDVASAIEVDESTDAAEGEHLDAVVIAVADIQLLAADGQISRVVQQAAAEAALQLQRLAVEDTDLVLRVIVAVHVETHAEEQAARR